MGPLYVFVVLWSTQLVCVLMFTVNGKPASNESLYLRHLGPLVPQMANQQPGL